MYTGTSLKQKGEVGPMAENLTPLKEWKLSREQNGTAHRKHMAAETQPTPIPRTVLWSFGGRHSCWEDRTQESTRTFSESRRGWEAARAPLGGRVTGGFRRVASTKNPHQPQSSL